MIDQNTPSDAYVSPESTGASAEDIVNRFESEEALVSAVCIFASVFSCSDTILLPQTGQKFESLSSLLPQFLQIILLSPYKYISGYHVLPEITICYKQ